MKIQNKLAIKLSAIYTLILTAFCVSIFLFSKRFTEQDFYRTLEARSLIAANIYLEADELSEERMNRYRHRYMQTMDGEVTRIYNMRKEQVFFDTPGDFELPDQVFQHILHTGKVSFREGDRQYCGIFYEDNQGDFVILTSAIDASGIKRIDNLRKILLAAFILSLIIIYVAGRVFARQALQPIKQIVEQVDAIHVNNLSTRLNEGPSQDEINELSQTFNKLLDRMQAAFTLQQTFISNASHELRTPITAMLAELELAMQRPRKPKEYQHILGSMHEETERLYKLTESILNLAKASADAANIPVSMVQLDEQVLKIREDFALLYPKRRISLGFQSVTSDADLRVVANPQLLDIAIRNILDNALKFSDKNSKVEILISSLPDQLRLSIRDYGYGIAADELNNIFEVFYRASNSRSTEGYGIGLALVKKITEIHQGSLQINSTLHQGTEVIMLLPKPHSNT